MITELGDRYTSITVEERRLLGETLKEYSDGGHNSMLEGLISFIMKIGFAFHFANVFCTVSEEEGRN